VRGSDVSPSLPVSQRIRCREITDRDIDGVVGLLSDGFAARSRGEWSRVLSLLKEHPTPPGFPKYGYLLEHAGMPVGVLLLIFTAVSGTQGASVRCNVSSWYVRPAYRSHAALLSARALRHKDVTYFNISPAPHTLPILEAQHYRRYAKGIVISAPVFAANRRGVMVTGIEADFRAGNGLAEDELQLLRAHAGFGCIVAVCHSAEGRSPFVFVRRRKFGMNCYAYLTYCRGIDEFVRFAGPLGRFLVRRGLPLVAFDANGPIEGLPGRYVDAASPKYFKGPNPPRLGDLAFSERVMFGF
jgi:hypothetical protein